jgi:hypothetical protein
LKIAFDEHIPPGLVRMFKSLAEEKQIRRTVGATGGPGNPGGIEVVLSRDYNPAPEDEDYIHGSDAPWLQRFAGDGGKVIISGNTKMMVVPHELLAIQKLGLTAIFFEEAWNNWDFYRKCSLLLWHWTSIVETVRSAKSAALFRIPTEWKEDSKLLRIKTPRKMRGRKSPVASSKLRSTLPKNVRRQMKNVMAGQGALDLQAQKKSDS